MLSRVTESQVLDSCYHTPTDTARRIFYVVTRAGHLRASPDYRIERRASPGHDLLYCVRGEGYIQVGGRRHRVTEGELAWIDGHRPHVHWPDAQRPWELLWIRLDGAAVQETSVRLSVGTSPVFRGLRPRAVALRLRRIVSLLRKRPLASEALVHAEAAALIAHLFETRQAEASATLGDGTSVPADLEPAITQMSLYFNRPWRVDELSRLCGMSAPRFYRRFRAATGSSPIDWLRRERIRQVKRRLNESDDQIKEIAEQTGYADPFFLSRDFSRYVGVSPRAYRLQERARPEH